MGGVWSMHWSIRPVHISRSNRCAAGTSCGRCLVMLEDSVDIGVACGNEGRGLVLDVTAVSRMFSGSRAVPFAVIRSGFVAFANPGFAALFGRGDLADVPLGNLFAGSSRTTLLER